MAGLGSSDLSESTRLIAGVRPAAVLYGCTSATLTHGVQFDEELARDIAAHTKGGPNSTICITAASALVQSINSLGVTKVGFSSPYLGEINDKAVKFMADSGIETVARADIGRELDNYGQGELTPDQVYDLAMKVNKAEVEAIVLSCTDMRSVEAIDQIEKDTGKPVVTSNQAMIYQLCLKLNLANEYLAGGQLLKNL